MFLKISVRSVDHEADMTVSVANNITFTSMTTAFSILLKSPTSTITVRVDKSTLVHEVKQNIKEPLRSIRLFHRGKPLENTRSVVSYGIEQDSTLNVFFFNDSNEGATSKTTSPLENSAGGGFSLFENSFFRAKQTIPCCTTSWKEPIQGLYIFADVRNISLSAQYLDPSAPHVVDSHLSAGGAVVVRDTSVRLAVNALDKLVIENREVLTKGCFGASAVVGSANDALEWRNCGYHVHCSNGVGEDCHFEEIISIMRHVLASNETDSLNKTLVFLSGDGSKNTGMVSFPDVVEEALFKGFCVEVWTWRASCSRAYRKIDEQHRHRGRFLLRFLDDDREEVTVHVDNAIPESTVHVDSASETSNTSTTSARTEATSVVVAIPIRRVPCHHGPSCVHLQRGRCTFVHTPAEVAAARSGQVKLGHWTCAHCSFLNRPSNKLCGGAVVRGIRRLGCGAPAALKFAKAKRTLQHHQHHPMIDLVNSALVSGH